jgi:EAL domain-containing protein (putative c-di-GMP-specific phosphodiesterase class I)
VKAITDPREVLAAKESWRPDLVLLDLHMPHIDGISLLRAFAAQGSPSEFVPVLVLTADVTRETLKRALTAGANDYLTKPVDVDEVLLRVRNLLSIRLSHESLKNSNAALATVLRQRTEFEQRQAEHRREHAATIRAVIERGPNMVFQPIIDLESGRQVGVEALARFDPTRSPDRWFAEATALGLGTELEVAAVDAALQHLQFVDARQFMAVNVSPAVLLERSLHDLVRANGAGRVVIEVTEHQPVDSYDDLGVVCSWLRRDGVRIAIDDAGAGYASLHHILKLDPDIIKLDMTLTREIDRDPVKRALAGSLLRFAAESDIVVVAEGIETPAERATLRDLGVPWGQGFHIGRPEPMTARSMPAARTG